MEFLIILILLCLNGLLAMYEMALVSSSKIRLTTMEREGKRSARRVLRQLESPEQTLSTIQIGITLVGIVSGAYGGMALADDARVLLEQVSFIRPYAESCAMVLTVGIITYLSLVIGELVPKALALSHPERYASLLSGIIAFLTWFCYPVVAVLSFSTKCFGKLLGINTTQSRSMTHEELKMMLQESSEQGVLDPDESEMLQDVFRFSDRRISELMTPRHELVVLHADEGLKEVADAVKKHNYSRYLLMDSDGDDVLGVIAVKDLIPLLAEEGGKEISLTDVARPALYLPESLDALQAIEQFKKAQSKFGVIINEYGVAEGIVTLHDLTESIFGDIPEENETPTPDIIRREDGTLLIEGSMNIDDFFEETGLQPTAELEEQPFNTVGGMAMYLLERLPREGDVFDCIGCRMEVIDMDGERVDKLLLTPPNENPNTEDNEED